MLSEKQSLIVKYEKDIQLQEKKLKQQDDVISKSNYKIKMLDSENKEFVKRVEKLEEGKYPLLS